MTEQTHRPNHRQTPPWGREADSEPASFGAWLRRQREMREITLREISEATKISLRYLEALEQERFDLLPAKVFARGFLRQYARYVGLDPDEAVNRLLVAEEEEGDEDEEEERSGAGGDRWKQVKPSAGTWKNVTLVGGLAALLVALVFLVPWLMERLGSGEGAEEPPPGVALPEAVEERPAPPPEPRAEVPAAPLEVTLDFRQNCWVEASVDGEPRVAEMRVQGESLQLQAQERVTLRLGNAGAVEVEVNGRPFDLGAAPGEVKTVEIDLDDLPAAGALPGGAAPGL
jgi:cytoskeletal protein RodZ